MTLKAKLARRREVAAKFQDKADVIAQARNMAKHGGEVLWAVLLRDIADWLEQQPEDLQF